MRFTLYPIYRLSEPFDPEPFDLTSLPFEIQENVRIEAVAQRFRPGTFDLGVEQFGTRTRVELEAVRYSIVHRYNPDPVIVDGEYVGEQQRSESSEKLVREMMACLRLIRPTRQRVLLMSGLVREDDGSFDVTHFELPPLHLLEVPEVQKLFTLRNRDCEDLRRYAPHFVQAMRGDYWKYRMAVQFHELGIFSRLIGRHDTYCGDRQSSPFSPPISGTIRGPRSQLRESNGFSVRTPRYTRRVI